MQTESRSVPCESVSLLEIKVRSASSSLNYSHLSYFHSPKTQVLQTLRKSFQRITIVILLCAVTVGLVVACAPMPPPPPSTTIEIASDFPVSGDDMRNGLPLQKAVWMAINDANNESLLPGYKLVFTPYNDTGIHNRHDPQKGVQNVNQIITDNLVAGIIGPLNSSVAQMEMPITNQAPIAQISSNTSNPCLTKNVAADPNCSGIYNIEPAMRPTGQLTYFRLATTDDIQGKVAADYLFTTKHYRKVILFKDDTDTYSHGLAQVFYEEWMHLGGDVIPQDKQETMSSELDYQNALQSLVSFKPDLVYFAGNDPNGTYALQALTSIPALKTVAFAGSDALVDPSLPQIASTLPLSAPVYGSLPIVDPAHSGTALGSDFQTRFNANGGSDYFPYAGSAYDSTMMLIQAIKTALQQGVSTPHGAHDQLGAKQFRQAVLQALRQNKYTDGTGTYGSYTGATGMHSFDSNGDTTNPTVSFYQLDLTTPQPGWKWVQQMSG